MRFRTRLFVFIVLALTLVSVGSAFAQSPLVPQQEPGPDGSIVHVVHYGDTLSSIMAAYAPYGVTMESLQELNGWRFPPQYIYPDEQIIILPPGSVAPGNGIAAPAGTGASAAPAAPPAASDAAAPVTPADASPAAPQPEVERLTADQIAAITPVEAITPFLP